jgi:hypothetical protein
MREIAMSNPVGLLGQCGMLTFANGIWVPEDASGWWAITGTGGRRMGVNMPALAMDARFLGWRHCGRGFACGVDDAATTRCRVPVKQAWHDIGETVSFRPSGGIGSTSQF